MSVSLKTAILLYRGTKKASSSIQDLMVENGFISESGNGKTSSTELKVGGLLAAASAFTFVDLKVDEAGILDKLKISKKDLDTLADELPSDFEVEETIKILQKSRVPDELVVNDVETVDVTPTEVPEIPTETEEVTEKEVSHKRVFEGKEFDVDKAVAYITNHAHPTSTGMCARSVRQALQEGGLNVDDRPSYAGAYAEYLPKKGWTQIPLNSELLPGDIIVILPFENEKKHKYGHIAMWNGSNWVSDFIQKDKDIYTRSGGTPESVYRLFRYGESASAQSSPRVDVVLTEQVFLERRNGNMVSSGSYTSGGKEIEAFIQDGASIYSGDAKGLKYKSSRTRKYHNLGNLTWREGANFYEGQVGYEVVTYKNDAGKLVKTRFAIFSDPYYGIKANYFNSIVGLPSTSKKFTQDYSNFKSAYNYIIKHGKKVPPNKKTLYRVMSHYAPYGDLNDPYNYASKIANDDALAWPLGVDTMVDLAANKRQFISFYKVVSLYEQGTTVSPSYLGLVYDAIFNGGPIPLQENLNEVNGKVVLGESKSYFIAPTRNYIAAQYLGNVQVR